MGWRIGFISCVAIGATLVLLGGIDQSKMVALWIGMCVLAVAAVIGIILTARHNKDHPDLFDPAYIDRKVKRYSDGNLIG